VGEVIEDRPEPDPNGRHSIRRRTPIVWIGSVQCWSDACERILCKVIRGGHGPGVSIVRAVTRPKGALGVIVIPTGEGDVRRGDAILTMLFPRTSARPGVSPRPDVGESGNCTGGQSVAVPCVGSGSSPSCPLGRAVAGVSSVTGLRATIDFAAVDAPGDPFEVLQIPIWYPLANVTWKPRFWRVCTVVRGVLRSFRCATQPQKQPPGIP
jgi:hypothetical protein